MAGDERLAEVLRALMDAMPYTVSPGLLAKLSGVPKGTIVNWLEARVTRPRRWQDVVMIADALRLSHADADRLLAAAGYPGLAVLARSAEGDGRGLLEPWLDGLPVTPSLPPRPATTFVGRRAEMTAIAALVLAEGGGVVTLLGPAGVGKSRLALEVAHGLADHFADGVSFVAMSALDDPALVMPAIAMALGVSADEVGVVARIAARLATRQVLVVLDDAEAFASSMHEVCDLFARAPRSRLMVTSRSVLRLSGERQVEVVPLPVEPTSPAGEGGRGVGDAVALFVDRARLADPGFELHRRNERAVVEICRRLDGLPLSIELAAARVRLVSPHGLLGRLDRRFRLLTWAPRDFAARHQSLRSTLDWSFVRLTPAAQELFVILGGLPAGFDVDLLQPALAPELDADSALDSLMALVDCSLVQRVVSPAGEVRHRLLDTMAEYAREQATERGLSARVADHALRYVDGLVDRSAGALFGGRQAATLSALDDESANITMVLRAAVARGAVDAVARIAARMWPYWLARGMLAEGRHWLAIALADEGLAPDVRGPAAAALARLAREQGDLDVAEALLRAALEDASATQSGSLEANALGWLGVVAYDRRDFVAARSLHDRSLALRRALGDEWGVAATLTNLAEVSRQMGDDDAALPLQLEAKEIFYRLGDRLGAASALTNLGHLMLARDELAVARSHFRQAIEIWVSMDERCDVAEALDGLANVQAVNGIWLDAVALMGAARRLRLAAQTVVSPADRGRFGGLEARAIEHLGPERFGVAVRAGAATPLRDLLGTLHLDGGGTGDGDLRSSPFS